jgi:plastocyanin
MEKPRLYLKSVLIAISISIISATIIILTSATPNALGQTYATTIYESKSITVPPNVKNLVILIPNEGHHGPGEEDESRFIAQPFVPQNAAISPGTQVVWYNGDVGHEHNIVVRDSNGVQLFQTGIFPELEASRAIAFNNTGNFAYADTIDYEEGFVMTGNISVIDQKNNVPTTTTATTTAANTIDTAGVLMVPSIYADNTVQSLKSAGFGIDSMQNFKDLRGGQEDTGDIQTLLVWTANGMELSNVIAQLKEISSGLPYE